MARPEKEAAVQEIKERLERAQSAILTDYRGLNVQEVTELRKKLTSAGVEYRVLKNTLTGLAAKQAKIDGVDPYLSGPTALAFGYTDPVSPAKILSEFAKAHKNLQIKGGIVGGKVVDSDGVKALADLPGRPELLSMLLRSLQGPLYGLVTVLSGNIRNLAYALEAVRKQREEHGS